MQKVVVCKISDEDFGGYNIAVDVGHYRDVSAIAAYVKKMLVHSLRDLSLHCLVSKVENKKFHIHDKNLFQIHQMNNNEILYVCGHC